MDKVKLKQILLAEDIVKSLDDNIEYLIKCIPEIELMIGFEQNHPYHYLDVWEHTKEALKNSPIDYEIRFALLFHDIGKPFSYQDEEVRHFHGHPEASAKILKTFLKKYEYDNKFTNRIVYLVEKHDTPIDINNLDCDDIGLVIKRLDVQYADMKAHRFEKVKKKILLLDEIRVKLQKIKQKKEINKKEERDF